jgi:hypothetical protein
MVVDDGGTPGAHPPRALQLSSEMMRTVYGSKGTICTHAEERGDRGAVVERWFDQDGALIHFRLLAPLPSYRLNSP